MHLLDVPEKTEYLKGILLELEDGAYPLLTDVKITEKLEHAFKDIDLSIFLGGSCRRPGIFYQKYFLIHF